MTGQRIVNRFSSVFILLLILMIPFLMSGNDETQPQKEPTPAADTLQVPDSISIIAVGDIMLGTNYPSSNLLPPNNGADLLAPVAEYLQDADLAFGNLEGVLLTGWGPPKCPPGTKNCYAFKSPDDYVHHFKNAGFTFMSLANNHSNDFGEKGRKNTVRLLDEQGIHHAGLLERPTAIFEHQGLKIGFCAFAPNLGTVKLNDSPKLKSIIINLKKECHIVIVSLHTGAEGKGHQHVTRKAEYFLGENRGNPYQIARDAIDAGADLILGHGPHVPRAIDLYKNRFIAYSLGNFATYSQFNLKGVSGHAPMVKITLNSQGEFTQGQIISARQYGKGGPLIDPEHHAAHTIRSLTAQDFPSSPLQILNDGTILKR